ncbi:MAG: alpha/beta hydrolase [Chloroflexi bacterium]|nr:MAG: alpha/beta hydrolase [Chloroflexota bacterium]
MIETLLHKWLKVPHALHVGYDSGNRGATTTVVLIHGLASSHSMWNNVIKEVKTDDIRIIAVDLLGFGDSPKPVWQIYSAKIHAASLRATLRKKGVRGDVVLVGHSLGALVAVQYASLYPGKVNELVLCSPPFYRPARIIGTAVKITVPQADDIYRSMYRYSRTKTELAKRLAGYITRAKIMDEAFVVTDETLPAITSSLEMSIENQTSLQDAEKLSLPMHIIYGRLDPFIIKRNLRQLNKRLDNVTIDYVLAGHEITGSKVYTKKVIDRILQSVRNG